MPTTVIPGFLYFGTYDTASRQDLLKTLNISHILNTVPNCQALYKNTFTYHTVSNAPPDFEECFQFLDMVHKEQNRVLVYCMSGQTRSPTVVIGYLMKHRGWRLAEAYKWVKDKRPSIQISEGDTKRLMELEVQLHNSCSVPLGFGALSLPALNNSPCRAPVQNHHPYAAPTVGQPAFPGGGGQPFVFGGSCPAFTMGAAPAGTFVFGHGMQDAGTEMES